MAIQRLKTRIDTPPPEWQQRVAFRYFTSDINFVLADIKYEIF